MDEEVEPIFVSRMPNHKVKGAAHMETIRKEYIEDGKSYSVTKVPLTSLKLKNGEIENYFNPASDMLLYNALKERLAMFGGDGKKAFTEPFYKPKNDGTQGPEVKKVKLKTKSTLSVQVQNKTAIADNGSMVRVDVFYVEGEGYYLVPIYVSDTVKPELPNKAIVAHKPYEDWKEMKEEDFVFSLYPNDLVKIRFKKEMKFALVHNDSTLAKSLLLKEGYFFYRGTGITNATISIINHDNTYHVASLGVKTLPIIEKYQVDVLGNITKSGKEKRMRFR
jgi:CRISPR-associated endonuclease Csn1